MRRPIHAEGETIEVVLEKAAYAADKSAYWLDHQMSRPRKGADRRSEHI